jgi:hypothetical protein
MIYTLLSLLYFVTAAQMGLDSVTEHYAKFSGFHEVNESDIGYD